MSHIRISCTGIKKVFERAVYPTVHLQDHVLHWRRHKKMWRIEALKNIDMQVKDGEWVGLMGSNGSGKTTLLRIMSGLLPADEGEVKIDGKLSTFLGLGVGFHPERSAAENIYLHGLLHGLTPREIRKQTDKVIEFAGVQTHRDLPLKCYSTGMTLRLAYAATVFIDSDIYLFDEIQAVGDMDFQAKCKQHMHNLRRAGKTVIFVSHNYEELRELCDRIMHIDHGAVRREEQNGNNMHGSSPANSMRGRPVAAVR